MAPAPETPAQIATACARRSSGEASTRAERVAGITAAVPTPARPRSAMWVPGCSTSPDASDATANKGGRQPGSTSPPVGSGGEPAEK